MLIILLQCVHFPEDHRAIRENSTDQHFYFVYDKFYDELKRGDWNQERARTATMVKQYFKGEFDCQKRFPKGDNEESFPPLRVLKLPKEGLEKEEIPEEIIEIEDKENIV